MINYGMQSACDSSAHIMMARTLHRLLEQKSWKVTVCRHMVASCTCADDPYIWVKKKLLWVGESQQEFHTCSTVDCGICLKERRIFLLETIRIIFWYWEKETAAILSEYPYTADHISHLILRRLPLGYTDQIFAWIHHRSTSINVKMKDSWRTI